MHVPEVLAVDEGEGGAVRQPLGEVLGHVVRRRDGLVQDQRRVLGRADVLHLKGDQVFTESARSTLNLVIHIDLDICT